MNSDQNDEVAPMPDLISYTGQSYEDWLHNDVVKSYDEMKQNPESGISTRDFRKSSYRKKIYLTQKKVKLRIS